MLRRFINWLRSFRKPPSPAPRVWRDPWLGIAWREMIGDEITADQKSRERDLTARRRWLDPPERQRWRW